VHNDLGFKGIMIYTPINEKPLIHKSSSAL